MYEMMAWTCRPVEGDLSLHTVRLELARAEEEQKVMAARLAVLEATGQLVWPGEGHLGWSRRTCCWSLNWRACCKPGVRKWAYGAAERDVTSRLA